MVGGLPYKYWGSGSRVPGTCIVVTLSASRFFCFINLFFSKSIGFIPCFFHDLYRYLLFTGQVTQSYRLGSTDLLQRAFPMLWDSSFVQAGFWCWSCNDSLRWGFTVVVLVHQNKKLQFKAICSCITQHSFDSSRNVHALCECVTW